MPRFHFDQARELLPADIERLVHDEPLPRSSCATRWRVGTDFDGLFGPVLGLTGDDRLCYRTWDRAVNGQRCALESDVRSGAERLRHLLSRYLKTDSARTRPRADSGRRCVLPSPAA
jgi:hypothetical protein